MLVLTRHRGESIMIGNDIRITCVDLRGDKVRLGIEAPREVSVHRNEVYLKIKENEPQAKKMPPPKKPELVSINGVAEDLFIASGGEAIQWISLPKEAKKHYQDTARAAIASISRRSK